MKQFLAPMLFIAFVVNARSQSTLTTSTVTKTGKSYAYPDSAGVYTIVQQQPEFPGGEKALMEFVGSHMQYPAINTRDTSRMEGKVIVRFVINEKGTVEDVRVWRSAGVIFDAEAIRVVRLLPDFIPGRQQGQPVKVYFNLPFTFKLQ